MTRPVVFLAAAIAAALAIFRAIPGLDIAVSALFYDGTSFPVQQNVWVEGVRQSLYAAEDIAAIAALLLVMVTLYRRAPVLNLAAKDWGFQLAVFVVGPGVMANLITKPLWGRARPSRITQFGGASDFTQVWQWSDQCSANCSFVSGEMSGAVALAVALFLTLAANRQRLSPQIFRLGQTLAFSVPVITFWQRIAAGRHFLSDVVFGGLMVGLIAALLHGAFYRARH